MVSSKIRVYFGVTMLRIAVTPSKLRRKYIVASFCVVFYLIGEMLIAVKLDDGT